MKKLAFAVLMLMMLFLAGYGADPGDITDRSEKVDYHSDTSAEDCFLCGGGIENIVPSHWGQNNVALISLNTFEIKPIEINRYE